MRPTPNKPTATVGDCIVRTEPGSKRVAVRMAFLMRTNFHVRHTFSLHSCVCCSAGNWSIRVAQQSRLKLRLQTQDVRRCILPCAARGKHSYFIMQELLLPAYASLAACGAYTVMTLLLCQAPSQSVCPQLSYTVTPSHNVPIGARDTRPVIRGP
jgi:hypothetical protein